jgi:hypothetical protein
MLEWEKVLVKHQTLDQELYEQYIQFIREMKTFYIIIHLIFIYIDDIFITTNLSVDRIKRFERKHFFLLFHQKAVLQLFFYRFNIRLDNFNVGMVRWQ